MTAEELDAIEIDWTQGVAENFQRVKSAARAALEAANKRADEAEHTVSLLRDAARGATVITNTAADEIRALRARVAELEESEIRVKHLEEIVEEYRAYEKEVRDEIVPDMAREIGRETERAEKAASELTTLRARVAELEGALRPFADKAAKWEANHPIRVGSREHSHSTQVTHRLGDFRRARDVLEGADLKGASHEQG
jgi:chromosome segregation ATPase